MAVLGMQQGQRADSAAGSGAGSGAVAPPPARARMARGGAFGARSSGESAGPPLLLRSTSSKGMGTAEAGRAPSKAVRGGQFSGLLRELSDNSLRVVDKLMDRVADLEKKVRGPFGREKGSWGRGGGREAWRGGAGGVRGTGWRGRVGMQDGASRRAQRDVLQAVEPKEDGPRPMCNNRSWQILRTRTRGCAPRCGNATRRSRS